MSAKRKRHTLLATAAAIVAVGAVVATVTAKSSTHPRRSPAHAPVGSGARESSAADAATPGALAIAAGYLGVPPAKLRSELRSELSLAQIANAAHGKSAAGLIDALVAERSAPVKNSVGAPGLSPSARRERLARLRRRITRQVLRLPGYVGLPASARYLGVSVPQLRAELEAGRSLAQIADATPGKSATGLIDARVSAREAAIRAAVTAGRTNQAHAVALLSSLRGRITQEVQRRPQTP